MKTAFARTGREHLIVKTNLLESDEIRSLGRHDRRTHFGRIDILINNIERGGWPVVHGPYVPEQWDLEQATTLRAKWWVFDAVLPHLKAGGDGAVINFSSIAGMVGRSGPAGVVFNDGYAAANRGISSFTETWARLGAPEVRVNEIMLGFIDTRHGPGTRGWDLLSDDQRTGNHRSHPAPGEPVRSKMSSKRCCFILKEAPFMTGKRPCAWTAATCWGEKRVPPMPKGVV